MSGGERSLMAVKWETEYQEGCREPANLRREKYFNRKTIKRQKGKITRKSKQ
jgi:hypothetical protein